MSINSGIKANPLGYHQVAGVLEDVTMEASIIEDRLASRPYVFQNAAFLYFPR